MPNTILVVEDYDDTRRLYKLMLEDEGFRVLEAADAYKAAALVKKELPNLILMDMSMPGMDGVSATRLIRGMFEARNITIIGITAYGNLYNEKAMAAGCNSIISKPIDLNKLNSIISLYVQP
jgi:two-component system, cell cycle response regulator DivK